MNTSKTEPLEEHLIVGDIIQVQVIGDNKHYITIKDNLNLIVLQIHNGFIELIAQDSYIKPQKNKNILIFNTPTFIKNYEYKRIGTTTHIN